MQILYCKVTLKRQLQKIQDKNEESLTTDIREIVKKLLKKIQMKAQITLVTCLLQSEQLNAASS